MFKKDNLIKFGIFLKKRSTFIAGFSIVNLFLFFYSAFVNELDKRPRGKYIIILAALYLVAEIVLLYLLYFGKKKNFKPEKILLMFLIPLGAAHILVTPLDCIPDELAHIARASEIANGNIIAQPNENGNNYTAKIPMNAKAGFIDWTNSRKIYNAIGKHILKSDDGEIYEHNYANTANYNVVGYIPQAIGLLVGKLIHLPPLMTYYLGRFFALFAFAALCYFALKIMPKYKEFMLLIMLLPETIQQGASYSVDAMLNGCAFLTIALVINCIYGKAKNISNKNKALLLISSVILTLFKGVIYAPILLLNLLIPSQKLGGKKNKAINIAVMAVACVVAGLVGSLLKAAPLTNTTPTVSSSQTSSAEEDSAKEELDNKAEKCSDKTETSDDEKEKVDDEAQLPKKTVESSTNYVKAHPFRTVVVSVGTLIGTNTYGVVESIFGSMLDYNNQEAPVQIYTYIMVVFVAMLLIRNTEKIKLKKIEKYTYWVIPIVIIMAQYVGALIYWSETKNVDASFISGIQGRYFIPLLALVPFMLHKNGRSEKKPLDTDYIFLFGIFANMCILACKFFLFF